MRGALALHLALLVASPQAAQALETPSPLSGFELTLQIGYAGFFDGAPNETRSLEGGISVGLAGYGHVGSGVYLGAEAAIVESDGLLFGDTMRLFPLELNAKYAYALGSTVIWAAGGGLSLSHAEVLHTGLFSSHQDESHAAWLLGGQVLTDLVFRFGWFTVGLDAKLQLLEGFEPTNVDFSNLRVALRLGLAL